MAESALLKREVATKGRGRADGASKKLRETVLEREQLTATVADLQRALASQQAEDSSFSCETAPCLLCGVSCSAGPAAAAGTWSGTCCCEASSAPRLGVA